MANYGSHPEDIAKHLEDVKAETMSSEILLHLAKAYKLVLDLEETQENSTYLRDRQLMIDAIEKAWREALYVRASLPPNLLEVPQDSPVNISRMGVISENEENINNKRSRRSDEGKDRRKTNNGISKKKRGARHYTRRISRGTG